MMRIAVILALLTAVSVAQGQDNNADLGHSIRVEYQYAYTSDYVYGGGSFAGGNVTSHALVLSGAYSINERWKLLTKSSTISSGGFIQYTIDRGE